METRTLKQEIEHFNDLLKLTESIGRELDTIHEQLFHTYITRNKFAEMVERRQDLLEKQKQKERELKAAYKAMKEKEKEEAEAVEEDWIFLI